MTEFNMTDVVTLLARLGVSSYVEQTGGGVATIYAGQRTTNAEGDERWDAVAGPGRFDWAGQQHVADFDDFYVGYDDQGDTAAADVASLGALCVHRVAALVALYVRCAPDGPDFDSLESVGLDGSLRGLDWGCEACGAAKGAAL